MRQSEERSAVLVIRAWHEEGESPEAVRARLTQTPDTAVPGWEQSAAAGEEQILAAVRAWLDAFIASG
jgi:hypothetical protein